MEHELKEFNPAEYLDTKEAQQAYIDEAAKTGDTGIICDALGTIAKIYGMGKLAEETGLNRETLYRTLSSSGNPTLETLIPVVSLLDIRLSIGALTGNQ